VGDGLKVHGPLILRILGDAKNLILGNNVELMPMVDLKLRENGRIILHDGVFLDTVTRLVAARDACIELGEDVRLGLGSLINAGADVIVGRKTLFAGYCHIQSSEHRFADEIAISDQGYEQSPIYIGEESWLGGNCFVGPGSRLGPGVVLGTKTTVLTGDIPAYSLMVGTPARFVRSRRSPDLVSPKLPDDLG